MYKVIIADDHFLIRDGIIKIFDNSKNYTVAAEVSNGDEALKKMEELSCDLLISDISMPDGIDGIELTKRVKKKYSDIRVVLLTMFTEDSYVCNAINSKADGMISKDSIRKELITTIDSIMNGEKFFLGKNKQELDEILNSQNLKSKKISDELSLLTYREIEVFKHIAEGISSAEIAERLFIDKRTVDSHRHHIMSKLNIKSLSELVAKAAKLMQNS